MVDDSATARAHIVEGLHVDYECLQATDGAAGLALALEQKPDAMIVDLEMPVMDGVTLLERLKSTPSTANVPVIICTTSMAVDLTNRCRQLGCASFVLKPVDINYLLLKLRRLIVPR